MGADLLAVPEATSGAAAAINATFGQTQIVAVGAVLLCWAIAAGMYARLKMPGRFMAGLSLLLAGLATMAVGVVVALFGLEGAVLGGVGGGFVNAVVGLCLLLFSRHPG